MPRLFSLGAFLLCAALVSAQTHTPRAPDVTPACPLPAPVDRIYQLPDDEMAPLAIFVSTKAGDVEDWGHRNINLAEAWKVTKGKGAKVAILDTGCDFNHRDLKGRVIASKDFTSGSNDLGWWPPWRRKPPPPSTGAWDAHGHGTHCAGVVGAAENDTGMVGVAPECMLLIGKVLDDTGSGSSRGIAAGIDWAVDNGADVISMSLGGSDEDEWTQAAVKRARAKGVIVVAAAGNEGPGDGTIGFPGGYPESICVGATDSDDKVANFSSRGNRLDVAAPGVNVKSCYPGDRFATMSGTSMATPYVAGCAALYVADCKARNRKASPDEFRKRVQATSRDLPPAGHDNASGYGLIQPAKILAAAGASDNTLVIEIPPEHRGKPIKKIIIEFDTPAPQGTRKDEGSTRRLR